MSRNIYACSFDIDPINEKIYYSVGYSNEIRRANLDGTARETFMTGILHPNEVVLDLAK